MKAPWFSSVRVACILPGYDEVKYSGKIKFSVTFSLFYPAIFCNSGTPAQKFDAIA